MRYLLSGLCVALAAISGANAFSSVISHSSPQLAITLSPYSAGAYERLATMALQPGADEQTLDVSRSRPFALKAFRQSALTPDAATILASAQSDPVRRNQTLDAIGELSLRGRVFNSVALQTAVAGGESERAMAALERMLLVYPSMQTHYLPAITAYLSNDEMLPAFRDLLADDPDWADAFFSQAKLEPAALRNLGRLRVSLGDTVSMPEEGDARLQARLSNAGFWDEAFAVYQLNRGGDRVQASYEIDTAHAFPPFDWALADEGQFHARVSSDANSFDVRIASGKGGVLAQRIVQRPADARAVQIEHSLRPTELLNDMTISAHCVPSGEEIGSTNFESGTIELSLARSQCGWAALTLEGRAWSGGPGIEGSITGIRFLPTN